MILEEARKIGEMLRLSEEYQRLLATENLVQQDTVAAELFQQFSREQNRIKNNAFFSKLS